MPVAVHGTEDKPSASVAARRNVASLATKVTRVLCFAFCA
jgi:hypothetical protein